MTKKLNVFNMNIAIEEKQSTFTLTIDEEWDIEIQNEFGVAGIAKVTENLAKTLEQLGSKTLSMEILAPYFYILLIKEFTDLGEEIPDDLGGQTSVVQKLIELGLFVHIIEALPKEEVMKVVENIEKTTKSLNENVDEYVKLKGDHKFINDEIKNM